MSRIDGQPLWVGATTPFFLGAPVSLVPGPPASGNAEWELFPSDAEGGPAHHIRNRTSGKCLDIAGPSKLNGTNVHLWNCHSGASQSWRFDKRNVHLAGHYITNLHADKCLDVTAFRNRPDTLLQIYSCSFNWNQRFILTRFAP